MLHLIYKKLKKNKILLLSTSFLSLPTLLISCIHPYQEFQKQISKSLVPPQGSYNPKTANPEKGSPILEENSEIITNSVLGFNGQKKNPKEAKNRFDVTKNYTEEIVDASFISGKYGLLPYWYFLQSIPKYLENKGFGTRQYNKEEYLKRLNYFYTKIRDYRNNNLVDYQSPGDGGAVEVWKQGLKNQFREFAGKMKRKSDNEKPDEIKLPEDLGDKDKVDVKKISADDYLPIIKPELDRYNAQIPDDEKIKFGIVFDFLLANERIWPSSVDKVVRGNNKKNLDQARLFRDEYYIEKDYKPSDPEKLWYELGWFMLRPQRIISSANAARNVLESIHDVEKRLFELADQNKDIGDQLNSWIITFQNFTETLDDFLKAENHLNLRKDLVFNIDISNNQDDQSLISDFIEYYNQKIAPIIWRVNLKRTNNKILTLTKLLKNSNDDNYFNKYLAPLLPEIKDLRDEEDIKNDQILTEEQKEKAIEGAKKAGIKEWGIWLKNYQDKYGIKFKEEQGIDNEHFDESSLASVPRPERINTQETNNPQQTQESQGQSEAQSQN
ncbi:hypothetical protein R7U59_03035 [Mesomycoplasma ovipneumoniae]|uniref:hypothetical protein n=1 Tax=Mesomycoplasma ovipneumoniae TaxID=29562 RepID=UPI002964CF74|nr:hypothetical protein [Mesomycoplasma ovipneumoniae]MDW2835829.1 hypothetical protein [Mesomycoplasma ovipneumoniae]